MWKELITSLKEFNNYVEFNPPADCIELKQVEDKLNVQLPYDLKKLLSEFNGDNWFVLSTTQIIEDNTRLRATEAFMPLDHILFIARNGCGDYLGYAITGDGLRDDLIYFWDHELDNRIYKASSLEELICKYYSGEI